MRSTFIGYFKKEEAIYEANRLICDAEEAIAKRRLLFLFTDIFL